MENKIDKSKIKEQLSKRIIGTIFFVGAFIMTGILFYNALEHEIKDRDTALSLIKYFLSVGALLWGISLFDGFRKKLEEKK